MSSICAASSLGVLAPEWARLGLVPYGPAPIMGMGTIVEVEKKCGFVEVWVVSIPEMVFGIVVRSEDERS